MTKTFHFLSGLPRSGSTVLSAILNQNPAVHVTPTSPLLDTLINNQNIWHNLQTVKANPIPQQLTDVTQSIIHNFYDHIDKPIIIDKNRGWSANMPATEVLFEKKMKMIACVRDIPSIMASWLTLLRNNAGSKLDVMIQQRGLKVTDEVRLEIMWNEMVKSCVDGLNKALADAPYQVHLVEYDSLIDSPRTTLQQIEYFLELPTHEYDFNNIQSLTNDDDLSAWGLNGMHTIRQTLNRSSKSPREILGDDLYRKYSISWRT